MRRYLFAGLVGFVLRGAVTSWVLRYVWRRDGACPECRTPARDRRDACGCHKGCTTLPHACARPCRWPGCLTAAEGRALADEVDRELRG